MQNLDNLAQRQDDALVDLLAVNRTAFVPFFPAGGLQPAAVVGAPGGGHPARCDPHGGRLAWLLRRSPNILLVPGTSSTAHLRENVAGAGLTLSEEDLAELDPIGRSLEHAER